MIKARGKNQRYLEEVTARVLEIHNLNQDLRNGNPHLKNSGDIDEALVKVQIYLFDCNNTEIDFLDLEIGLLFLEPGVVVRWFNENGECVRERRFLQ